MKSKKDYTKEETKLINTIYQFLVWYEGGASIFLDGKGAEIIEAYMKYLKEIDKTYDNKK